MRGKGVRHLLPERPFGCFAQKVPVPFSLRYLAVLACFIVGLAAKPMAVTLPFLLLLLDYWPLGRFGRDAGKEGERREWGAQTRPTRSSRISPSPPLPLSPSCSASHLGKAPAAGDSLPLLPGDRSRPGPWLGGQPGSIPLRGGSATRLISYVAYLGQLFCPGGPGAVLSAPACLCRPGRWPRQS